MLEHLDKAFAGSAPVPTESTPLGDVAARDNFPAAEAAAEAVAPLCAGMDREGFAKTVALAEARPTSYRPDDPRLLLNAPPLRDERERRQYAAFRSALSVKEHEEARKVCDRAEIRRRDILRRDGVDVGAYLAHCLETVPDFETFFSKGMRPFAITAEARERHTYVTGKAGSGKTEVLKNLAYEDIAKGEASVIVIDPHGDFAEDVARFDLNRDGDRLVFLDPRLSLGLAPCFNPFDIPDEYRTPETVDAMADNLAEVFVEMLKSSGLTVQMRSLLKPILATLLMRPGSNITDILDFFDEERSGGLMAAARRYLVNPAQLDFLARDFRAENYHTSKAGISARIRSLTNSLTFNDTMTGPATVRLNELMDARKVVVVRLSGGVIGQDTAETLARFILASIKNAALFRQSIPYRQRVPCHVFVDECQLFVTESMERVLNETRKYRVHLTLAQQIAGWGMDNGTKRAVFANTAVKITGMNGADTLSAMAKETGASLDELQTLGVGKFHVQALSEPGAIVRIPSRLAHGGRSMPEAEWERIRAEQLARYYRTAPRRVPSDEPDAPSRAAMDRPRKKPPEGGPARPIPSDDE